MVALPAEGDLLYYDSAQSLWVNGKAITGDYDITGQLTVNDLVVDNDTTIANDLTVAGLLNLNGKQRLRGGNMLLFPGVFPGGRI